MTRDEIELIAKKVDKYLIHPKCIMTKVCQETESFKGTPNEGVDMCTDGCVWHDPRIKGIDAVKKYIDGN